MTVVIKPNFVIDRHENNGDLFSIITHPSLIKIVIKYVKMALGEAGRIVIADAPQYNCNFSNLLKMINLDVGDIEIVNLQPYWSKWRHFKHCEIKLSGDKNGVEIINLGKNSSFESLKNKEKLYGAKYRRKETIDAHTNGKNIYEISKTILNADVLISLPKLKVHKKVGVTLNCKGLVGINVNKNLIPHYRIGSPKEGGDQYPDNFFSYKEEYIIKFERFMYDTFLSKNSIILEYIHRIIYGFFYLKIFRKIGLDIPKCKKIFDAGNWYGNDTCWRSVSDLIKILENKKIKTFSIVDGIIGGEEDGPLCPTPKKCGILVGGEDLVSVDIISTILMGFDPRKIKYLLNKNRKIEVSGEILNLKFKPHPGWKNKIER